MIWKTDVYAAGRSSLKAGRSAGTAKMMFLVMKKLDGQRVGVILNAGKNIIRKGKDLEEILYESRTHKSCFTKQWFL